MKKKIAAVLSALMIISCLPSVGFAAGETISTITQLETFRNNVNSGNTYEGQTVTLSASIDLSSVSWTAIGTEEHPFMGTFDGGSKEISGLNMSSEDMYAGLFGYSGGTIKNLNVTTTSDGIVQMYKKVDGVTKDKRRSYIGIIAAYNKGTIESCTVEGLISSRNEYSFIGAGGIAGYNEGTINSCTNKARLYIVCWADAGIYYADAYAGGICGINEGIVTSSRSEVYGKRSDDNLGERSPGIYSDSAFANAISGGVIGDNRGTVSNSTSSGTVGSQIRFPLNDFSYAYSGGICGSNTGTVDACSSNAYVFSLHQVDYVLRKNNMLVGGISGYNKNKISNCTFSGKLASGHNGDYTIRSFVGGITGYNYGTITSCEFAAEASVTDSRIVADNYTYKSYSPQIVGGIVGKNDGGAITLCKSNGSISCGDYTHDSENVVHYYGGIAGINENGTISVTSSKAKIILDNDGAEVTKLPGKPSSPMPNTPTENDDFRSGGLAGKNSGRIENCYYAPDSGTNHIKTAYSAGLVSDNSGVLENCYANFKSDKSLIISADGIANTNSGFVRNCLYYSQSEITSIIDGTQKTLDEFSAAETYAQYPIGVCWTEPQSNAPVLLTSVAQYAFSGGDGTAENPYIVKTAQDLYNIRFFKDKSFKIVNDITFDSDWSGIGDKADPFTGTINGNHHTITLVKSDGVSGKCGIISYGKGCRIENINVKSNLTVSGSTGNDIMYAGAVIAFGENAYIEHCTFDGTINITGNYVYCGGIAGSLNGTIIGCVSSGDITQSGTANHVSIGGIAGVVEGTVSETYSTMNITVSGASGINSDEVGGLCGILTGNITGCGYDGTITNPSNSEASYTGGLVGSSNGEISKSYSDAKTEQANCGGIVGIRMYGTISTDAYYNADLSSGYGTAEPQSSFTDGTLLGRLRTSNTKYIWTTDKTTQKPVPMHVTPVWTADSGFIKLALQSNSDTAEIYYTTDGTDPKVSGAKYTAPFFCEDINKVKYYTKDGSDTSTTFDYGQRPLSKYPLQFTALPKNQNGESVTKENINSATEITVNFLSDIEETNAKLYLAVFDEKNALIYAKVANVSIANGQNTVTFDNVATTNTEVSSACLFIWNNTLKPYTEEIKF